MLCRIPVLTSVHCPFKPFYPGGIWKRRLQWSKISVLFRNIFMKTNDTLRKSIFKNSLLRMKINNRASIVWISIFQLSRYLNITSKIRAKQTFYNSGDITFEYQNIRKLGVRLKFISLFCLYLQYAKSHLMTQKCRSWYQTQRVKPFALVHL